MTVLNSVTASATLGEIVIHTLPAGNEAVDPRNGEGHRLTTVAPTIVCIQPCKGIVGCLSTRIWHHRR